MSETTITALVVGLPVVVTAIGGFLGVSYKVGKWNGKVTRSVEKLSLDVQDAKTSMDTMEDKCEERMNAVATRMEQSAVATRGACAVCSRGIHGRIDEHLSSHSTSL